MKIGAVFAASVLAGCSASVSRFDLGYSDGARTQSGYASSGTTGRVASAEYGSAGYDRRASGGSSVARSELAPMTTAAIPPQQGAPYNGDAGYGQGYSAAPSYDSSQRTPPPQSQPSYAAPSRGSSGASSHGYSPHGNSGAPGYGGSSGGVPPVASRGTGATGDMIEVRPGDTLYSLSRRHGVSVNALKSANGLTSNDLRPGQQLHLPAAETRPPAATVTARPPRENYETVAVRPVQQQPAAEAPSDWTRSYTVRQGDSLYGIARQNGVKLSDLERYNRITDSRKVMPGTVLKVPGEPASEGATVAEAPPPAAEPPRYSPPASTASEPTPSPAPGVVRLGETPSTPPAASTPQQPTMLNGTGTAGPAPERVAKAEQGSASDAVSPSNPQTSTAVAGFSKLRWPVAGKVISAFGPRPDGTHNDGVNLAAPIGTDIHAAENGVVAYAGDELKGYGNLVLVRHDNGWVTAYAHADEILVKRGDRIKRGQVIAKAGRTGQVDQPQVHFELRQGQKPVDPTPFMERL
ncbi:peptidoglycan DD-metalloendopeptidase family protein [Hyphomicrobium sp.]|uniref:peptidoglycan DD-metalloendopeptidase family protein n=1 Tax=Hyphomicrobium sp. TaxID=82 RepID=UPI0025BC03E4|nr:peptidoglycan DD-metalloendopeptidase family protein [Hyphomicrobium sp.]MCC7251568.1 peptidoglycan DD-metalloendopeptidase family protein [Hyphomicrobium sp.]